jgi:hypothetical protein
MRRLRTTDPVASDQLRRCLYTTAEHLLSHLDEFWQMHKTQVDTCYDQRIETISFNISSGDTGELPSPYLFPFQNTSDAYFASMYDAGNLIVLGYLANASPTPTLSAAYRQQMMVHGASILASAAYQEAQCSPNSIVLSTLFPLKLLCLLSPSEEQKIMARNSLKNWGSPRGLTDAFEVVEPTYLDRSHG